MFDSLVLLSATAHFFMIKLRYSFFFNTVSLLYSFFDWRTAALCRKFDDDYRPSVAAICIYLILSLTFWLFLSSTCSIWDLTKSFWDVTWDLKIELMPKRFLFGSRIILGILMCVFSTSLGSYDILWEDMPTSLLITDWCDADCRTRGGDMNCFRLFEEGPSWKLVLTGTLLTFSVLNWEKLVFL